MNRDVCEHFNPVDLPCDKCQGEPMTTLRQAAQQALEAWDGGDTEWFKRAYTVMEALRAALAEPVQRKPLTVMELQDALVYTNLIDPDAVNDPEGYDEGSTLAQIDELHRRLTT